jgi:hypothetical protein
VRTVRNILLLGAIVGAATGALVLWQTSDWTAAWISFAVPFFVFALGAVLGRSLRSSRYFGPGLWLAHAGCGVVFALGIPNHKYEELGFGMLAFAATALWQRHGDRVKPGFYRLFGGPDPPQDDPVRVFAPGSRLAAIAAALSGDAGKAATEPKDSQAQNGGSPAKPI